MVLSRHVLSSCHAIHSRRVHKDVLCSLRLSGYGKMLIKDVVCLVTGGASGLGLATAKRLLNQGARVVIADLASDGPRVAEELGANCTFVKADVSSEKDIDAAVSTAKEKFGLINLSVNCAGINVTKPTISDDGELHSLDLFEKAITINATGTFNVSRLVAMAMTKNTPNDGGERGVIINVSSVHGFEGQGSKVAYSATKGAINAMTLPLARDLAKFGIRVNTIAPGMFETPMFIAGRPDPVGRVAVTKTVPFPSRAGTPDEFAHLVQAVIENPMINGEVLRIDGAVRLS